MMYGLPGCSFQRRFSHEATLESVKLSEFYPSRAAPIWGFRYLGYHLPFQDLVFLWEMPAKYYFFRCIQSPQYDLLLNFWHNSHGTECFTLRTCFSAGNRKNSLSEPRMLSNFKRICGVILFVTAAWCAVGLSWRKISPQMRNALLQHRS